MENSPVEIVKPEPKVRISQKELAEQILVCDQKIAEQMGIIKKYEGIKEFCRHAIQTFEWGDHDGPTQG